MTGSSIATVATMGSVVMPEMRRYNYDTSLATGSLAASGTLGILIPPSMLLGGKMIEDLGIEAAFIVAVSIMVAATIIGIVVPSFRRFERIATERFPITADQSQSD